MDSEQIKRALIVQAQLGLDEAIIRGNGYEALITKDGIVVGRAYLGTIEEVEQ